jgi:hypothetical protein
MKLSISILSLAAILLWCCVSVAQEPDCGAVAAAGRIARATSITTINATKQKAGNGYRAQLVLASRVLELRPGDKQAAVQLLNLIPKNDAEQTIWMTLGDALCGGESVLDMRSLADIRDRFPRNLTKRSCWRRKGWRNTWRTEESRHWIHIATTPCRCKPYVGLSIRPF